MVHVRWSPTSVVTGALTALALACDAGPTAPAPARVPSGPSLAVVDHRRDQPFAFDVDACDQTVHVSGEFHILNTVTITRAGNRSDDIHINAEGSGVGTSGARYNWNDVINQSAHEPADQAPL